MTARILSLFRNLLHKRAVEQALDDELQFSVELLTEEKIKEGYSRSAARRLALIELGGVEQVKEEVRSARFGRLLEDLAKDIRFAFRTLRKSPGFAAVAILSLALGIGANALVFSVVNSLLLRPLPVEHPEELAFVANKTFNTQSFPNYRDVRDRNKTFAGLAGYRLAPMELESSSGAMRIWGLLATGNYFDMLGVHPLMGRFFHQADDLRPGASPYAVMSYAAWRGRFGSDPGIVGKTVRINRLSYTVLGVAPPDFHGTELWYWPEIWVPMMMEPQIENYSGTGWLEDRGTWNTWVLGRLKSGTTPSQALANLNGLASELAHEHPNTNEGLQFKLTKPGLAGDYIRGPAKAFTLGVLGLAGVVLLAACSNLASLLAARSADRLREIAIRVSMGASRSRVVRQILTETLVLSIGGGTAGCALAVVLSHALSRWRAPMDIPVQFDVNPDWRVFLFAFAVSLAAGAIFGCAPAWRASKTDANAILKGAYSKAGRRRPALRDLLVVLQVALCFVLVAGCLISLRGLQQALRMRLGFVPEGVSVAGFDLGLAGYSEEKGQAFQQHVLEAVANLPGVTSAAYSNSVPLGIDQSHTRIYSADSTAPRVSEGTSATYYQVSPGFFKTMGTRLLAGREFDWHDDAKSPRVAVVNLAFARRVLHSENAVGKQFRHGTLVEVVGVAEDGKYESLTESQAPVVFWPILQNYNSSTTVEVRSSIPAARMAGEMRRVIAEFDSQLPLYGTGGLDQMLGFAFFPTRAAAVALSAFGVLAIMLAVTGIHGLVSYSVARRVREIGIRVALGAARTEVLRLVLGRIFMLVGMGSVIGLLLALAEGQVLAGIVYQGSPRDPVALAGVFALMSVLGLCSSWMPTRRALRIEPTSALRYE